MLKRKRQHTDDGPPAVPDGPKLPIDQILNGPRPGTADPEGIVSGAQRGMHCSRPSIVTRDSTPAS